MELIVESKLFKQDKINDLMEEANELSAIFITCVKNVKKKVANKKNKDFK